MSDYSIAQIEKGIEDAKYFIKRREMAQKLYENPDFKELFVNGFFKEEAARLVQLSSDPAMSAEQRADALSMAQATGHTKRYLSMIIQMANQAEKELPAMYETIDELRSEEADESME